MRLITATLFIVGLFTTTQALAIVEGNSAFGYRMTKTTCCGDNPADQAAATGYEVQLGGHVDPFPILPMALGGTFFYHQTGVKSDLVSSSGWGIDVETKIWYPIPRIPLTLYAKGGYTLIGGYSVSTRDLTEQYTPSGLAVSGGMRLDILFRGAIFVQVTHRQTELKGKKETARDTPMTVLAGVQIGL